MATDDAPRAIDVGDRILRFYRECFRAHASVASIDLITDAQTKRVIEWVGAAKDPPRILDYGCGSLRLLNALLRRYPDRAWQYVGVDVDAPGVLHPDEVARVSALACSGHSTLGTISGLRQTDDKFDVAVLMNVLHELPLAAAAEAFEDIRQHLVPDGVLLFSDPGFLVEGEPRFVPYFPWEIETIFTPSREANFRTSSGVPILYYEVGRSGMRSFQEMPRLLQELTAAKRDALAMLTVEVTEPRSEVLTRILKTDTLPEFAYAYLTTCIANACLRLAEFELHASLPPKEIDRCARAVFVAVQGEFGERGEYLTVAGAYDLLGRRFRYSVIRAVLSMLVRARAVFPSSFVRGELQPTEIWDIIEQRIGIEKFLSDGAVAVLDEAALLHEELTN